MSADFAAYSPLVLAYMGDSYYETLVRRYIIGNGDCTASELNKKAKLFVTAAEQSRDVEVLLPLLNEKETSVYKSGRNAKSAHSSRSAGIGDYRRATGLEALFGWLFISGELERAEELFASIATNKYGG